MTFSCPNLDEENSICMLLETLCVPGRPGCIQEHTATFALDLETRIHKATQRAEAKKQLKKNRPTQK
jgi:hypothetical protein